MFLGKILSGESYVLFFTCAILLVMSVASWTIASLKWRQFRAIKMAHHQFLQQGRAEDYSSTDNNNLWGQLQQLLTQGKKDYLDNQFISKGLSLDAYIGRLSCNFLLNKRQEIRAWLPALASIGAMAPFIGLFGTVLGIYHALMHISTKGQVMMADVTAPIGEALLATAFGLFVAVPAILFYNVFITKSTRLSAQLYEFSEEFRVKLMKEEN